MSSMHANKSLFLQRETRNETLRNMIVCYIFKYVYYIMNLSTFHLSPVYITIDPTS